MKKVNVVVQTAFIGDLFLSIPLLLRLKKKYPDCETILVCKKGLKEIFTKWSIVEHVFEVEKGNANSYNSIVRSLNEFDIENVFCLHQSLRSTLFTAKLKAKNKIGFGVTRFDFLYKKIFFNNVVAYHKAWPDVIRQMSILNPIDDELNKVMRSNDWTYLNQKNQEGGFQAIPEIFQFPQLDLFSKNRDRLKKSVALFPGSVWATKKWTHEGFGLVAKRLTQQGFRVCIMGGPDDLVDSLSIQKIAPETEVLTGKMSLYESSMYVSQFDLIICNDSAPAHIAASLQRPVLSLFGPTVLDFGFRPWNDKSQVIETELSCRPCGPHGHAKCPLGHHDCMRKISADFVYDEALKMLNV
jgi:heptosyltransferase-2